MESFKHSTAYEPVRFLKIYKNYLCLTFIIVFSISLLLLGFPSLTSALMTSSDSILSAFTSVFVHKDLAHLGANVIVAFITLTFYSLSNRISAAKNGNFIIAAIWISTILANLAFVRTLPYMKIGGSSGLVSATMSAVMIATFFNAWAEPVRRRKAAQIVMGVFLLVAFVVLNVNVNPDTNVTVHLSSFSYTALIMLAKQFFSSYFSRT